MKYNLIGARSLSFFAISNSYLDNPLPTYIIHIKMLVLGGGGFIWKICSRGVGSMMVKDVTKFRISHLGRSGACSDVCVVHLCVASPRNNF